MQIGDRPVYDALLRRFPVAFHEPYYHDFIERSVSTFEEWIADPSNTASFAKLLVVEKPGRLTTD